MGRTRWRDFGREAANNVLDRVTDVVLDEIERRKLVPCVMAEEFRLRLESLPRWRRIAKAWCRWRWRVWVARCKASEYAATLESDHG
jgi:hypothetical protein